MRKRAPRWLRFLYAILIKPRWVRYALILGGGLWLTFWATESLGKSSRFEKKILSIPSSEISSFTIGKDVASEVMFTPTDDGAEWLGVRNHQITRFSTAEVDFLLRSFENIVGFEQKSAKKMNAELERSTQSAAKGVELSAFSGGVRSPMHGHAKRLDFTILKREKKKSKPVKFSLYRTETGVYLRFHQQNTYFLIEETLFSDLNKCLESAWK